MAVSQPLLEAQRLLRTNRLFKPPSKRQAIALLGLCLAASFGAALSASISLHILLALAVLPFVFAVVWTSPRTTILCLASWLIALGLVRRLIGPGSTVGVGDPLLIVGPVVVVLLLGIAFGRGALRLRTPLANAVGLLSFLALIEAFNPEQGSLSVGFGGLLFVLVPLLSFWVGRSLLDDTTLQRLFRLIGILAVLSAVYGLVQQFVGFPSWDTRWINSSGYTALNVGGIARAFGNFASSAEYAIFLSVGLVVLVSRIGVGRRVLWPLHFAAIALVGTALVLSSVRGSAILTVVALAAMAAARAGLRPTLALIIGGVAVAVLAIGLSHLSFSAQANTSVAIDPTRGLLQHEVSGIANPVGTNSTLPSHLSETFSGISSAFSEPIGHGTGSVTLAAIRFGGPANLGTEDDPGNVGRALGLPGLLLYLVILILALLGTYRLARSRRDSLALATVGLLVVTLFQWLNGDLYSVAWLIWLTLGWMDRNGRAVERGGVLPSTREATHFASL